jgi:hypothetical protein
VFFCHRHRLNSKCRPGCSCRAQSRAGGLRWGRYHFPCCCFSRSVYSHGGAVWQEKLSVVVVGAPNKQTDRHRCRHLVKIVRVFLSLFRFVVSLAIFFFLSHAALYHRYCLLNEPQSRIMFAFDFEWYTQCRYNNNNNNNIL